jgi:hypothetical protein
MGKPSLLAHERKWIVSRRNNNYPFTITSASSIISSLGYGDALGDIVGFTQTKQAMGGCVQATIQIAATTKVIDKWLEDGPMRDIAVYDRGARREWNGFADGITATIGGKTIRRGPVLEVKNRLRVAYTWLDTVSDPPITGVTKQTDWANNLASQGIYGVLDAEIDGGKLTDADAIIMRDSILSETAWPETTQDITLGANQSTQSLTIDCFGYVYYLDMYRYRSDVVGTTNIGTRIRDVLAAEPNGILSTDLSRVAVNTLPIPSIEQRDLTGLGLIAWLVTLGDATYQPYYFGVDANRRAVYQPFPTSVRYIQERGTPKLTELNGAVVPGVAVEAGEWVVTPDIVRTGLPPRVPTSRDLRYSFIEKVVYTTPDGLNLSGAKISKLGQMLAQYGLAGMNQV